MEFEFHYDTEDDVLSIYSKGSPSETIEFSENLNIDIDENNRVVGLEIFDASEFFNVLNKQIDKSFLENLQEVSLEYKEFRNVWHIVVALKVKDKVVYQPMPLLRKSEYVSPLILSQ